MNGLHWDWSWYQRIWTPNRDKPSWTSSLMICHMVTVSTQNFTKVTLSGGERPTNQQQLQQLFKNATGLPSPKFTVCCTLVLHVHSPSQAANARGLISVLRLLKTYLHATMGQDRMSSLAFMYVHRNVNVDTTEVVRVFARRQPQKIILSSLLNEV